MARNKVELIIKNQQGVQSSVDVLDFPYRLNRTVFTTSQDRLKTLGGTNSTRIRLAKSKVNNKIFVGRTRFNSNNKFNNLTDFQAIITENGAQIGQGTFKLEQITSSYYEGTFFDQDINWVDKLSNIQLNTLGYVDGQPTWLVPFDGASSFNAVNDLSNNDTDYVCPTIVYNNTPITDYLDLTDADIWGTFDTNPITRITDGGNYPSDFVTENAFFGTRLGLTFEDFPPAVYYRNLLERVFREAGVSVECPLFNEDWFNKLIMPYVGSGYQYNWKNLATVTSNLLETHDNFNRNIEPLDLRDDIEFLDPLQIENTFDLNNQQGGTSGITLPTPQYANMKAKYKLSSCIRYDDASLVDKITAVNKFGIPGQYICPVDGSYTLSLRDTMTVNTTGFNTVTDNPPANYTIFDGSDLWSSYATQDSNSDKSLAQDQRHYGWDDQVLIIMRKSASDDFVYPDTMENIYKWMSGENKDFINNPSDVIAYISPKRWELYNAGTITDPREAFGSPITDNINEVTINTSPNHEVNINTTLQKQATAYADIVIDIELNKDERIEMFWVSLSDVEGDTTAYSGNPPGFSNVFHFGSSIQQVLFNRLNNSQESKYSIAYGCGLEDLDLARNLPNISGKDFISSFIRQFNLNVSYSDGTVRFLPQANYFSNEVYDITSRVMGNTWQASPLPTPREWIVGYNNDDNDRLLNTVSTACAQGQSTNYGNITFSNNNTFSERVIQDSNIFSATQFVSGNITLHDRTSGLGVLLPETTDPATDITIFSGIDAQAQISLGTFTDLLLPSIQSEESFIQDSVGDLTYDYNYNPRLIYHLGTVNQYASLLSTQECLIDSPRADVNFIALSKHWFRPTVSQFDGENSIFTGIDHPTLRYDTMNGIYNRYFEDLINLYNRSELLTLSVAVRSIDWIRMRGSRRIRYNDQLYRLSQIRDYDPLNNNVCQVTLVREI